MEYLLEDSIARINLDDGKANVVSPDFIQFVNDSLDRAQADSAGAVLITGREGIFSAGFDLKEFEKGMEQGIAMVSGGMALAQRLYGYPLPVVAACTGHAIAMGAFLLLACDTRIGARGDFRFTLPETRISMAIPRVVQPLCQQRLSPGYLTRAVVQSEIFGPDKAVEAGFLDEVEEPEKLATTALDAAQALAQLPQEFYAANKMFMRDKTLQDMQVEFDKALAAAG